MSEDDERLVNQSKPEDKAQEPVEESTPHDSSVPLFLRKGSEGDRGNAQDEKSGSSE